MQKGPDFLKKKYDLHKAPETEAAAKRAEKRIGEKVPQQPEARIQNYLDRFKEIIERKDPEKRERGLEALKRVLLDKFVTKIEDIPESYWKSQEGILRERGQQGDYQNFSEEEKTKWKKTISEGLISDQSSSLEQWIDYFSSEDSSYLPDYLKYWVFRSVIGLSEYDKEKKEFGNRSKGTVKQFPDINHEALAYVVDAVIKKHQGEGMEFEHDIQENERQTFLKSLESENFAKLYAWANELMNPIPKHLLPITEGEWRKYKQGSAHGPLVQSIRGHGTGWCTAGENTARTQLQGGDFYVYYSLDDEKQPTIPRLAIRMEEDKIAEVRGIAYKQNVDSYIGEVLEKKLNDFPDKDKYLKKDADMRQLTEIENKTLRPGSGQAKQELTKDDLIFLYEINSKIEGFGYQSDPRIQELRKQRNPEKDMLIIFDCAENQIAYTSKEINQNTKAYLGKLEPGIFTKLKEYNIEHIYTSFPEGRIRKQIIEIGGKNAKELLKEMRDEKINITNYSESLLKSKDFTTEKNPEQINLVRLKVGDLFSDNKVHTTDQIYQRAKELGLELCPAEVGPNLRLQYQDQPLGEWLYIGMKQISVSGGGPGVFRLERNEGGLWLGGNWAVPTFRWFPGSEFVFRG